MLHLTYTPSCRSVELVINLYINERRTGDVTILDLKGKLRVGGNTLALHKSIRTLVAEKKILILLNLTDVTFIDSSGLGELVASQVSVENSGGEIKLLGVAGTLQDLFAATRLSTVFDAYQDEEEAIQNFGAAGSKLARPQLVFA